MLTFFDKVPFRNPSHVGIFFSPHYFGPTSSFFFFVLGSRRLAPFPSLVYLLMFMAIRAVTSSTFFLSPFLSLFSPSNYASPSLSRLSSTAGFFFRSFHRAPQLYGKSWLVPVCVGSCPSVFFLRVFFFFFSRHLLENPVFRLSASDLSPCALPFPFSFTPTPSLLFYYFDLFFIEGAKDIFDTPTITIPF